MIQAHKKPHVCNNCGKRFKIEARYQRHSLICKDQNQNGNDHEKSQISVPIVERIMHKNLVC